MGRAKLEQTPDVAYARRAVDREAPPNDDRVAEAILDMALDYDDGDPVAGVRNALLAGVAFWTILASAALLLI
jgi:hypothetical protein